MFDLPIIKHPALYAGLSGLAGTASTEGLRILPRGVVYYVDQNHPLATDDNDGTDPRAPLLTIQAAVNKVVNDDTIIVMPGTYFEDVVTPHALDGATRVTLLGVGHQGSLPLWTSTAAANSPLTINAPAWRVSGFHFIGPAAAASIVMNYLPAGGDGDEVADCGVISHNWFHGGLYGIDMVDGIWWAEIADNLFDDIDGVNALSILASGVLISPRYLNIVRNIFRDCSGGIALPATSSQFVGNVFMPNGATNTCDPVLDLTVDGGGNANIVTGNTMGGDYSNTGGYNANATDLWTGNYAEDIAEAEVGDNGLTIAQPAA
jgi:hypothetical protein